MVVQYNTIRNYKKQFNMEKYILKSTGRELKLGDKLVKTVNVYGISIPVEEITISKEVIQDLVSKGVINVINTDMSVTDIISHLAVRIKWNPDNLYKYLDNLLRINPSAVYSTLLKEVSVIFDKQYKGHISNSKEIWVVSSLNFSTHKVPKETIKSYKGFAAFRSEEDALRAKAILKPLFDNIYGE